MDDLDRMLESYTTRYKEASQASPDAVEGALDRVMDRVAAGDPGMDLGKDAAANAAAATASGKVAVLVILGGAIAGAVWLGTREPSPPPELDRPASAQASTQEVGGGLEAESEQVIGPAAPDPEVGKAVSARHTSPRRRPEPESEPEPELTPADTMLEELELLRRARAAQRGGAHERALELLAEHERRFPESPLGEERMATRVVVLCGLGRMDEAKVAETDLRQRHPASTYLGTVQRACARDAADAGEPGVYRRGNGRPRLPPLRTLPGQEG